MTSSQGSDISLPSPDRVANLWRYGESPTKAQAFSEEEGENDTIDARGQAGARTYDDEQQLGTNIATPGHGVGSLLDNAEAGGGVDVNLQEREVSVESKDDSCGGKREFSSILDYYAQLDVDVGSHLQDVEQEDRSQSRSLEEVRDQFEGDIECRENVGLLELTPSKEGLLRSQETAPVDDDSNQGDREGDEIKGQFIKSSSQLQNQSTGLCQSILLEVETDGVGEDGDMQGNENDEGDKRTCSEKRTVSEANFDIDLDNMESDYDLESGKTPGEQHFLETSSPFPQFGNLDETAPFDETISDHQFHSKLLNTMSTPRLFGTQETNTGADRQGSNTLGKQKRCQRGGAVSGSKSTSTAWSMPTRGGGDTLLGAGNNYTPSTPLNQNYTSNTPSNTTSAPQANSVPGTPSRGDGGNFTTSTPIRYRNGMPEAPQWSPHPSPLLCGAGGDSVQVESAAVVSRQKPSAAAGLGGSMAEMQSSALGGFVTPSRARSHFVANCSNSVQVIQ